MRCLRSFPRLPMVTQRSGFTPRLPSATCRSNAEAAVPALVACLSDPQDYRVRCEAALALAHIRKRPEFVLPALTHNLSDTNETVRSLTASALARFRAIPQ